MPARVIHKSDGKAARDAGKKMFDILRSAIN
jgi:hypothetical protein